jgi:hypothetical protein
MPGGDLRGEGVNQYQMKFLFHSPDDVVFPKLLISRRRIALANNLTSYANTIKFITFSDKKFILIY